MSIRESLECLCTQARCSILLTIIFSWSFLCKADDDEAEKVKFELAILGVGSRYASECAIESSDVDLHTKSTWFLYNILLVHFDG